MIVLEQLDLAARRADFRTLQSDPAAVRAALRRMHDTLARLGVERVELRSARGSRIESVAAPGGTITIGRRISYHVEWDGEIPLCVARFPHRRQSLETVSLYLMVALGTRGPLHGPLHQLQLALYELCANTLEHGRPVRKQPELVLGLRMEPEAIHGWIHDSCESFDPTSAPVAPLPQNLANRSLRGYGLHLIRRVLGTLTHQFDGSGNHLEFKKEIVS